MTYQQYRAVRRLVHSCCNYQDGNCLLLDDGEECVCPQSICFQGKSSQFHKLFHIMLHLLIHKMTQQKSARRLL